jgi:phosphoribosyl 1,2-cyclic phosphodiesterase
MEIINLASSSAGNCYVLYDGHSYLLLEAGIKYKDLVKELARKGLKLTDIKHVLVSHNHKDHSVAANDISRFMTVWGSEITLEGVTGKKKVLRPNRWNTVGNYKVIGFDTEHDCPGALGFIIKSLATDEQLLFATDTKYIRFNLRQYKFDYVMLECNYDDDLLEDIKIHPSLKRRLINSHLGLKTAVKTLKALDLSNCKGIYLLHLSDRHANEDKMLNTVMAETGVSTYVALKYGGVR